jgi:TonB-linked SusC/RagA family outer membrane protein
MLSMALPAQTGKTFTMEGTVSDNMGPAIGATVYVKEKVTAGVLTDIDGKFSIKAQYGDWLVFSYTGYKTVEVLVTKEDKNMSIKFEESTTELDEVVVTALGSQRKISSLAAVTSVDVKGLQQPVSSVANLLGGRVAGIFSMQSSGEPGKNIADFWIRGIGTFGGGASALVLIDGLEGDINSIDPADIESFSVLKDASATAVYGVRGANGVILITTKRGEADRIQITGRASMTVSQMRRLPEYLGATEYATLANEAHAVRGEDPLYSQVDMEIIRRGLDRDMYPDVNWQDEVINDLSLSQKYYISARGGAEVAKYFISLGMMTEGAAYKTDKNSPYASNVGYNTYNYRVNFDLKLTPTTNIYFGSDGFLSTNKSPGTATTDNIWAAQQWINPLLYPVKYSNGQIPAVGVGAGISPYTQINSMGRRSDQEYKGKVTLAVEQKLDFITEGLKIRAQGAYDITSQFAEMRLIIPAMHEAIGRDAAGKLVTIERVPSNAASYGYGTNQWRKYHFESTLNYDRVFADDHRTSALVYYYMSDDKWAAEANTVMNNLNSIPRRYQGISSRFTYGFRDTYLLDLNFGYTGSENFEPGRQFGFFPSVALGWIPTQYKFVRDNLPFLSMLKFRASYGTVGNDRLAGNTRFPYLTRVIRTPAFPWTVNGYGVEGLVENFTGADNLLWEKATKFNFGIDGELFNSKVKFTVDIFNDKRDGIFQQRVQVPMYVGLSTMPYSNVGAMRSYGADGNISFTHDFNKDMSFTVRGNFTYAKNAVENWEDIIQPYAYMEKAGYPLNPLFGYQSLGLFKDEFDVETSPVQNFGSVVMPGDIKYRDVNGDGQITPDDRVPLGYNADPPMFMYGLGAEFRYKKVSLAMLFKGTGRTDFSHVGQWASDSDPSNGMGYVPFHGGRVGNVLKIAADPRNRWIPMDYALANGIDPSLAENPNARFPRLQYGYNANNSQLSDFWIDNSRYLRLAEVTLNYNLREPFLKKIGVSSVDIQLTGNNLLLWDNVKIFDPEQAKRNGGAYPIPSTYTLQLYLYF